ncbi:hypothetical protein BKI52_03195 [marine bacterium AO1-C]|nr:hypothetical protein BKI52_03195 [marine bacterium AO1-C]
MKEYFQGIIEYQSRYTWIERLFVRRCYYKAGSYLSIGINKNQRESIVNHLYTHHNEQYHKINHRNKTVLYRHRQLFNQQVEQVQELGEETIAGFECHKVEAHFINAMEGDAEKWRSKGVFWYAPQLLIDLEYYRPHQYFYHQSHPDIFQPFCFALQWEISDRFRDNVETTALQVTPQPIDGQRFDIKSLQGYELIDWNEKDRLDNEAREESGRKFFLTQQMALKEVVLMLYNRPLTEFEQNNPIQAFREIMERLSEPEKTKAIQLFLKNRSEEV